MSTFSKTPLPKEKHQTPTYYSETYIKLQKEVEL